MPLDDDSADSRKKLERLSYGKKSLPGEKRGGRERLKAQGVHSRGYLPHLKVEGGTYFVTFRLADSIPAGVKERMEREVNELIRRDHDRWLQERSAGEEVDSRNEEAEKESFDAVRARHRALFTALDRWLDAGHGACWLRRTDVAEMTASALRFFAGERYELNAFCIMPNHVHAVLRPLTGWTLSQVLHSWKSFTAKEAGKLIGSHAPGRFWMPETYDHWCRDPGQIDRCIHYTEANPVKARFCKEASAWPWSSARKP